MPKTHHDLFIELQLCDVKQFEDRTTSLFSKPTPHKIS